MLNNEDLNKYSVNRGDIYSIDQLVQTSMGLEKKHSYIGVVSDIDPWELTYDGSSHSDKGYLEYTQRYTMLMNLDLILWEQVIFYNHRQWLDDGDADSEHRTSSIESDRVALWERYGTCVFRARRSW